MPKAYPKEFRDDVVAVADGDDVSVFADNAASVPSFILTVNQVG